MGNDIAQGCDPPEDIYLRIQIDDLRLSWALHLLPRGMIGHRAMTSLTTRRPPSSVKNPSRRLRRVCTKPRLCALAFEAIALTVC
jgi:hypothetical protein